MTCKFNGCNEAPLSLSEFCWDHLPDKETYSAKLLEFANTGKKVSGHNLRKVSLKKANLERVDFSNANLSQADMAGSRLFDCNLEGADLVGTNLSDCDLTHCSFKGADFTKAHLFNARLWNSDLTSSNLSECDLSFADFWGAKLFNTKLWHAAIESAKSITSKNFANPSGFANNLKIDENGFFSAEESYRELKRYFLNKGMYNDASWASFKEKTMERLILKKVRSPSYLPNMVMNLLCGYGERPDRIVLSAISAIFLFAFLYLSFNAIEASTNPGYRLSWADNIYFSTITFTTVGFGDFIPKPYMLFRFLVALEAFSGVFLTGLFIFTLARKYSAR